jgi:hypothetical protein
LVVATEAFDVARTQLTATAPAPANHAPIVPIGSAAPRPAPTLVSVPANLTQPAPEPAQPPPTAATRPPPPTAAEPAQARTQENAQENTNANENGTLWSRIVGQIRSAQPALGAVLDHGMPLEVNATTLRLGFPEGSFFGRQAQSTSAREALLKAAEVVLGVRPNLLIGAPGSTKISTLAEIEENGKRERTAAKREAALTHPRVVDAMEIFEESAGSVDVQVDIE